MTDPINIYVLALYIIGMILYGVFIGLLLARHWLWRDEIDTFDTTKEGNDGR